MARGALCSFRGFWRSLVVVTLAVSALVCTPAAALAAPLSVATSSANDGFWTADSRGVVSTHGNVRFFGDTRNISLKAPIVGVAPTATNNGYWLVASDGGIFTFGDAKFFGSTGAMQLNQPVVGMASTATNNGYWLVASDGGIFTFGDARFLGSTGAMRLNKPVVGMAPSTSGAGYWLVASDGGIFTFGDAKFFGSTGAMQLNQPVVGMASTISGIGYWLVAADGGVFTFGDAKFLGSSVTGASAYGLSRTASGGYSVLRTDGSVEIRDVGQRELQPSSGPKPSTPAPSVPSNPAPVNPAPTNPPVPVSSSNPFTRQSLWVDPNNPARSQANAWRSGRPGDASVMDRLGNTATATWIGGWSGDPGNAVGNIVRSAANENKIAVLVAYNIPLRDCGQWSAGGAANLDAYKGWIDSFANGLGSGTVAIIVEPDSLALTDCLNAGQKNDRYAALNYAVDKLGSRPNTYVYLDAGHSNWHSASDMASRLQSAGVARARGFALNVSNFRTTSESVAFGNDIASRVNKPFVVDTSRNGNGGSSEWCNPVGRALGASPTAGSGNLDATLWIKRPGESDGSCNGGPSAGSWWGDYALNLARSAGW